MDELLTFVGWVVIEVILLNTGRAVVFIGSFGRWRGEKLSKSEGRIHGLAGALSFERKGRRVITATGLVLAGLMFYIALASVLIAAH